MSEIKIDFSYSDTINKIVRTIWDKYKKYYPDKKITHLKLQKLFYYTCSWHYTFYSKHINGVEIDFKCWKHGPVSINLYHSLKNMGLDYHDIQEQTIDKLITFQKITLNSDEIELIETVVSKYGKYSGKQLEELSHKEDPWKNTKHNEIIKYDEIRRYYEKK